MSTPVASYETAMAATMEVDARIKRARSADSPGGRSVTNDEFLFIESGFLCLRPWVYRLCDQLAEIGSLARAPEGLESVSVIERWSKRLRVRRKAVR